ncbi:E3 ubiquitin-protein ligase RNF123-like isoform X2 [Actinia tenebrosa]|uniref:RING-type E3 ubiquitin transferase n=1 Tax=Actinia tenebrosa TaxID=6105 RepID=A0A6P8I1T1_ACTTE|nr:E3 ubiquitin-protein ligase RNF123-like isoform X2 [Actinia tenebrosa]
MDVDQFLTSIFPTPEKENVATPRRLLEYSTLQEHIDDILNHYEDTTQPEQDQRERAMNDGRIGAEIVGIDKNSLCGSMNIKDNIELESQSNFSSVRSSICICKGKWMYEILLGSKGIMQLGWATLSCNFTSEEGVGDTPDSFAYDGHRVRKWNMSTAKYGEEWMAGDVIGCSLDLDEGKISYSRNGKSLGVAFDNVRYGPGVAYFPAVSLSYGESCQLNFGAYPFKFPMEGFKPLQDPPTAIVSKATELMNCLDRLLPSPDRVACLPPSLHGRSDTLSFLTTAHVFEKLGPLLTKGFVVEKVLLPFLLKSCSGGNPLAEQTGVYRMLDLMWACMEDFELEPCLENLLFALIKAYWYQPVTLDFKQQAHCLSLALSILRHHKTRRLWIECKIFPQKFSYFMHIRPPDDDILNAAFPVVWRESNNETSQSATDKEEYLSACQRLKNKVQVLEDVQVEMCKILLQDDDLSTMGTKSTRAMFLDKFMKYLQENMLPTSNLRVQPSTACGGPVITCFYHRLIQALRCHWDDISDQSHSSRPSHGDVYVPFHIFFDGSIQYWDMSRLGGLVSHLKKTNDTAIKEELNKQKSAAFGGNTLAEEDWLQDSSLVRMLDDVILLYHIAVHKQLSKVCAVRDSMQQNIKALEDIEARIKRCPPEREEVLAELNRSRSVFLEETTNCARHMAWVSTLIFTKSKQEDIHWMLRCILKSISRGAKRGSLFEFAPEFYVEVAINAFHGLRNYFHPTTNFFDLPDATGTLDKMAAFLLTHFNDKRIINPDLRDIVIQALAAFVCYPDSLKAVERMPGDLLESSVRFLLGAYDKRSWVQTTWILVRIWKGCGFAFRYTSSQDVFTSSAFPEQGHLRASLQPPCPSDVLQKLISKLCLSDVKLADEFLNGVLNQLNWAFSEFIEMLQEIQQATNRLEISLEKRQLRTCAVCFDLTVGLLRVLEMVSTVTPQVFTDWKMESSELHIARLFQLLTQVLKRITANSNLFENVTRLHLPGLETVDRFPVLGAVAGILITLLLHGTTESKERATSALLAEPGFTMESVEFLVGGKSSVPSKKSQQSFSFRTLANKDVNQEEVKEVENLVHYLEEQSLQVKLHKQESVDVEELCPICYAMKISVKFMPCGHVSCKSCITRHLMNNKECFFCKELVDRFEDISSDSSK